MRYAVATGIGDFAFDWQNTYVSYFGELGRPDGGNQVGVYRDRLNVAHRLKSHVATQWSRREWTVALTARYWSPLDEDCSLPAAFGRPDFCSNPSGTPQFEFENRIDDVWHFDLHTSWDAPWRLPRLR